MRTVVLRPGVLYGELDAIFVTEVIRNAKKQGGVLYHFGSPQAVSQYAYVGNVAWGFVCALRKLSQDTSIGGEAYFIGDETPLMQLFKFSELFIKLYGGRLSSRPIPYTLILVIVLLLEWIVWLISPIKQINLPISSSTVRYANKKWSFSYNKAKTELNYSPLFDWEESFSRSCEYYKTAVTWQMTEWRKTITEYVIVWSLLSVHCKFDFFEIKLFLSCFSQNTKANKNNKVNKDQCSINDWKKFGKWREQIQ